jgi:hypothetical protein
MFGDFGLEIGIDYSGFQARHPVRSVDVEDLVKSMERQDDATIDGVGGIGSFDSD